MRSKWEMGRESPGEAGRGLLTEDSRDMPLHCYYYGWHCDVQACRIVMGSDHMRLLCVISQNPSFSFSIFSFISFNYGLRTSCSFSFVFYIFERSFSPSFGEINTAL
jgi:hypothetical protein